MTSHSEVCKEWTKDKGECNKPAEFSVQIGRRTVYKCERHTRRFRGVEFAHKIEALA